MIAFAHFPVNRLRFRFSPAKFHPPLIFPACQAAFVVL